jgi:hypothetical protein
MFRVQGKYYNEYLWLPCPLALPPPPIGLSHTYLLVYLRINIIMHLAGYPFAAVGTLRRTPKLVSRAPLFGTGIWRLEDC